MTDRPIATAPALDPPDEVGGGAPTRRAVLKAGGAALATAATYATGVRVTSDRGAPSERPASRVASGSSPPAVG